jgi:hypothetical protein
MRPSVPKPALKQKKTKKNKSRQPSGMSRDLLTTAPVAFGRAVSMAKPTYKIRGGNTVICHTEFVSAVSTTSAFSAIRFPVNPGISSTFNWLYSVAGNYDRYRWVKLQFYYVPAIATSVNGRCCLSFSYDALQPTPITAQQMFSVEPNEESAVWAELMIDVPTDGLEYYVRNFGSTSLAVPAPSTGIFSPLIDLKTTDMGAFFFSSQYGANTNAGELFVHYELELLDPTASPLPVAGELYSTASTVTSLWPTPNTTVLGLGVLDSNIANSFVLNSPGPYLVTLEIIGTTLVAGTAPTLQAVDGNFTITAIPIGWIVNSAATKGVIMWQLTLAPDQNTSTTVIAVLDAGIATTITAAYLYAEVVPSAITFV